MLNIGVQLKRFLTILLVSVVLEIAHAVLVLDDRGGADIFDYLHVFMSGAVRCLRGLGLRAVV